MPPDPAGDPARWEEKAEGDLAAVGAMLDSPAVPPWVAGFHLQQAVEKALKGMLVISGQIPPRTHDIAYLRDLLAHAGVPYEVGDADVASFDEFGILERYPMAKQPVASREEVERLLPAADAAVEELRRRIRERLG